MEEMNWVDIYEAIQKGFTIVVIAVGSIEQHGPHLPTQTDSVIGDFLAHLIALKLENALQALTIRIGCSDHHLSFSGTISLKKETLKAIIADYVESLSKHGFKTIIFLPSHGGNFIPIEEAINELKPKYPWTKIIGYTNLTRYMMRLWKIAQKYGISAQEAGSHAGEVETSQMLAIVEDQVINERFESGYVGRIEGDLSKTLFEKGMSAISGIGVIGDPTRADIERGRVYLEQLADYICKDIRRSILD